MRVLLIALLLLAETRAEEKHAGNPSPELNRAAGLYYQAKYDSALAGLEKMVGTGPWKRRDSLVLYQYLGMSSARLGHDTAAVGYFGSLLALDSLFRFPRNEDPSVLAAFKRAREKKTPAAASAPPAAVIAPVAATLPKDTLAGAPPPPDTARVTNHITTAPAAPEGSRLAALPPPALTEQAAQGPRMTLGFGAIPLGAGWMARGHRGRGAALGALQIAGVVVSAFASEMQSRSQNDAYGLTDRELSAAEGWQWTQRVSLSVTTLAYLYSIIASTGE
jgi:hypothetical protein